MVKATETPPTTTKKKPLRPVHSPATPIKNQTQKSPPPLNSISKTPNSHLTDSSIRRSTRRNPILEPDTEYSDGEGDEEEDEREMKKQKLVQRLRSQPVNVQNSRSSEVSQSRSNGEKVDVVMERIGDGAGSEEKDGIRNVPRVTDAACRVLEEGSGPTTPLPDKKTMLFILDRLQKKDTHGVFSEPVDPEELPDYHDIIQTPMDFSTVRKKLDDGLYQTLEQFEEDIFLICSNAMQYNSPSTVFFRKARAIQELAKRDFDNLRQKGEDGEPQPRVIRRGRPPRTIEKSPEQPSTQLPSSESPSAAPGPVSDNSKTYNLRKGLSSNKFITDEAMLMGTDEPSCNGTSVGLQEWNTEFPASILRAPYGKKPVVVDESRRETYGQPMASPELPATNMLMGEPKRLVPVGLGMTEHYGYPSSLARFAAGLGPVAWKITLKKIKQSLPPGMEFEPLQFAYETPKFLKYEVDANLRPIFLATGNSNSTPTQTSPIINREEAAGMVRPQNNSTQRNGMTVGLSIDPDSDKAGTPKAKQEQNISA
ncbi:unnamed protein product [Rhodiola kirilowii]